MICGCTEGTYHVHARGYFYTIDEGQVVPLAHARVELMDSDSDTDTLLDDRMGIGYTDQNGYFEFDGEGDDTGHYWWSKPDVYARVVLTDDTPNPVRCADELNNERYKDTPEHDHDNWEGDVDFGSFIWGEQDRSTSPSVWLHAREVFVDYTSLVGAPPCRTLRHRILVRNLDGDPMDER